LINRDPKNFIDCKRRFKDVLIAQNFCTSCIAAIMTAQYGRASAQQIPPTTILYATTA